MPQVGKALEVKKIQADLLNFSFVNGKGVGQARDAYIEIGEGSQTGPRKNRAPIPQDIFVYRLPKDMEIQTGFATIVWKNMPTWMTVDLDLKADDIVAKLGYSPAHLITAKSINIAKSSFGSATVKNLKVECTPLPGRNAEFENLLDQCFKQSKITASQLDLPSLKGIIKDMLDNDTDYSDDLHKVGESLVVTMKNNNFSLELYSKIFKNASIKFTANGDIQLDKNNVARIQLTQVKIGKLNITKMILPVIGSLPLPKGIEVKAPYINVQL